MGFVRSLKKIFKNGKKENRLSDIENARMENEHRVTKKSKPVSRQKSMRTGIYEPYRNHFPLKQSQVPACQQPANRLPYGAYDPTKAKLITAGGEINMDGPGEKHVTATARPINQSAKIAAMQNGNYELFDWRQSNQSLNQYNPNVSVYEQHQFNRNGAQYGSNRSVLSVGGGAMAMNQNRNGPMRGSTRSFSAINFGMNQQQFMGSQQSLNMYQQQQQQYNRNNYEFHQVQAAANQQQQANQQLSQQQQREQRINQLSGRCGTGSVSSIHSLQSCTDRPSRPSSVQLMPTGPYQDWSVNKQRQAAGGIASASMSSLNAIAPQLNQLQSVVQNAVQMNSANPSELADAMRKMEECLQVFAQISGGKPTANQVQGNQMTNQMANQLARIEANRMAGVVSPTNIQNRSQNLLQPQPEFQKREQMKKRRQRRKSDISKMDLTELRRKLESIDVDSDTTENNSEGEKSNVKNIRKTSTSTDGGFYDGSGSSSDCGSSRRNAGSPTSSGDNLSGYMSTGSNSSDSGVVTPPIQKVKNMPEGSVKDSKKKNRNSNTPKSILKTNQQISFQI